MSLTKSRCRVAELRLVQAAYGNKEITWAEYCALLGKDVNMDLYCQKCGEPWDMDYVNFGMTPLEKSLFKKGKSYPSCKDKEVKERPFRAKLASALRDFLGDDEDGIAAEIEDAEALMGSKFWE